MLTLIVESGCEDIRSKTQVNVLVRLEEFAGFQGADFYGLLRNAEQITLVRKPWRVAEAFDAEDDAVVPLRAGEAVAWQWKTERL